MVAAALIDGGRVLVAQRAHPAELAGQWEFPGGKARARRDRRAGAGPRVRRGTGLPGRGRRRIARQRLDDRGGAGAVPGRAGRGLGGPGRAGAPRVRWARPAELTELSDMGRHKPTICGRRDCKVIAVGYSPASKCNGTRTACHSAHRSHRQGWTDAEVHCSPLRELPDSGVHRDQPGLHPRFDDPGSAGPLRRPDTHRSRRRSSTPTWQERNADPATPVLVRYEHWLGGVVHGDFGKQIVGEDSVASEMKRRIGVSLRLLLLGTIFGAVGGVLVGVLGRGQAAKTGGRRLDLRLLRAAGLADRGGDHRGPVRSSSGSPSTVARIYRPPASTTRPCMASRSGPIAPSG